MRRRQQGVALIAAVLVVALAVVLVAALLDVGEATRARSRNVLRAEQTWQLMHGLELWAGQVLMQDWLEAPGVDSAGEPWAQPMPPLTIPGGQIHGRLRERSGCFNLNNLVSDAGAVDPLVRERFENLLDALQLDAAIAAQAVDWIDSGLQSRPGGVGDLHYLQRRPAYRAANAPFVHVSELRLLAAVNAEVYARLAPEVCALPAGTRINLNFASTALWRSLHRDISETAARQLGRDGRARYLSLDEVRDALRRALPQWQAGLPPDLLPERLYAVGSDYFVAEADIVVDGIPYAYASLLRRQPSGVQVLQRSRGRL
jgi:general secretion pathway protein K